MKTVPNSGSCLPRARRAPRARTEARGVYRAPQRHRGLISQRRPRPGSWSAGPATSRDKGPGAGLRGSQASRGSWVGLPVPSGPAPGPVAAPDHPRGRLIALHTQGGRGRSARRSQEFAGRSGAAGRKPCLGHGTACWYLCRFANSLGLGWHRLAGRPPPVSEPGCAHSWFTGADHRPSKRRSHAVPSRLLTSPSSPQGSRLPLERPGRQEQGSQAGRWGSSAWPACVPPRHLQRRPGRRGAGTPWPGPPLKELPRRAGLGGSIFVPQRRPPRPRSDPSCRRLPASVLAPAVS